MKFLVFTLLGLLALVNSSPDSTSVDGKTNDEPKIVQFNIQCLEQPGPNDDDQVGAPAEESPLLSKLQLPNIKDKLNLSKNPKLRSIVQPREGGDITAESDPSVLPKLKDRLETLKKDGTDLRNLLLSKTQDMVGSSSADQPEVKQSLLPQLREKIDNLKEKIANQDSIKKLPKPEDTLNKLKEKLGKLKDKTERSDVVGAAQNNPSPLALPAPESTLNKLRGKLNELKNKSQKPADIVGAAQNEPSPSILLPPSPAMKRIDEKLNQLKDKVRKQSDIVGAIPSLEDLKSKVNDFKERAKNKELVGAAQGDSLSLALPSSDFSREKVREKINALKEKIQKPIDVVGAKLDFSPAADIKEKVNNLKKKLKNKDIVGAAQENSPSIISPSDASTDETKEQILDNTQSKSSPLDNLKEKVNNFKEKIKNMELVGAAQGDSPSITLLPPGAAKEKLEELKEKIQKQSDIVKSSQSLDNLNQKINDFKEKARSMDNAAVEKMKEKLNKLKEKSRSLDMVGAAQTNPKPMTISPPNLDRLKEKLSELKQRTTNKDVFGESATLIKLREKINNLKERNNKDIVGAAQNISPLSALPSPSETLTKIREKLNDMKEKSKLQDNLRAAQSNLLPKKLSPPSLNKLKDQLINLKQRSSIQKSLIPKELQQPSKVINKLREQVKDLRQKTRRSDLVGAAQNEAPASINLLDPLNIFNGERRNSGGVLGRQNIRPINLQLPTASPADRIENRVREISRLIPPIQLPTFEARIIPAPINLASFDPIVRNDRVIETVATLTTEAPQMRDSDGSASQVEDAVAVSPIDDEVLLETDEDQTANDSIMEPIAAPSKLEETKNKLHKLAESIKSRTAELVKPTVKPSLDKITSAIDNMKKKLQERKSDLVGSSSRAIGKPANKNSEVSYAGITQKEVEKKSCDICSCLMKYLGKSEESRAVPEKPKAKLPFSLKRPNSLFRLGDQNVLEDRIQPSFAKPPTNLRMKNFLRDNNIVGNSLSNKFLPGDDDKENIRKLMEFANLVEELDDYLARKTKTVITRLSKFIDAGIENE